MARKKMNPDIKATWLKALRSGRYAQGKYMLKSKNSLNKAEYCCLGVLCNVSGLGSWRGVAKSDYALRGTKDNSKVMIGGLNYDMLKIVGMSEHTQSKLMCMNDGTSGVYRHSFTEIADWIEKNI